MNENEIELYKKAIKLWGIRSQTDMVIEECSELINILMKDRRGKATLDEIISELVDVQIMLNQLRVILDDESKYERWMVYKLDRLQGLVEKNDI